MFRERRDEGVKKHEREVDKRRTNRWREYFRKLTIDFLFEETRMRFETASALGLGAAVRRLRSVKCAVLGLEPRSHTSRCVQTASAAAADESRAASWAAECRLDSGQPVASCNLS